MALAAARSSQVLGISRPAFQQVGAGEHREDVDLKRDGMGLPSYMACGACIHRCRPICRACWPRHRPAVRSGPARRNTAPAGRPAKTSGAALPSNAAARRSLITLPGTTTYSTSMPRSLPNCLASSATTLVGLRVEGLKPPDGQVCRKGRRGKGKDGAGDQAAKVTSSMVLSRVDASGSALTPPADRPSTM